MAICYHVLDPVTHTKKNPLVLLLLQLRCCNLEMMGWIEKGNQNPNLTFLLHTRTPIEVGYESYWCMYTFAVSSVLSRPEHLLGLLFSPTLEPDLPIHSPKGRWWRGTSTIFKIHILLLSPVGVIDSAFGTASEERHPQICVTKQIRHCLYLHCATSGLLQQFSPDSLSSLVNNVKFH